MKEEDLINFTTSKRKDVITTCPYCGATVKSLIDYMTFTAWCWSCHELYPVLNGVGKKYKNEQSRAKIN